MESRVSGEIRNSHLSKGKDPHQAVIASQQHGLAKIKNMYLLTIFTHLKHTSLMHYIVLFMKLLCGLVPLHSSHGGRWTSDRERLDLSHNMHNKSALSPVPQ